MRNASWGCVMTQPAKAQEPSMEEILASIRRIISDDESAKPPRAPDPVPQPAAPSSTVRSPAAGPSFAPAPQPRPAGPPSTSRLNETETGREPGVVAPGL